MKKIKIWKNTSALDNFSEGLEFTNNKNEAEIILLGSQDIAIKEFTTLRGIFRVGVGQENIPFDECSKKNVIVQFPSNETKKILYEETANFTISLIYRMAFPQQSILVPWVKENRKSFEKKSCLVIGLGNIGVLVKKKLESIMHISTYDLLQNEPKEITELIKSSDFITLHIPGSRENHNFFDSAKLNLMKEGAILINTSRANLVDEDSLYREISKGKIKAAFDVFWNEPYAGKLKDFHPENFYISPHLASSCEEFYSSCRTDLDKMIHKLS